MYTDFNHLFTVTTRNVWHRKVKLHLPLPPHLYSVTPLPTKTHTIPNIDATFLNVQHFKVYSKKCSSTYSILAYLFTAMFYDAPSLRAGQPCLRSCSVTRGPRCSAAGFPSPSSACSCPTDSQLKPIQQQPMKHAVVHICTDTARPRNRRR